MFTTSAISLLRRPLCHYANAIDPIGANAGTSIMRIGEAIRAGVRKVAYPHKVTASTMDGGR